MPIKPPNIHNPKPQKTSSNNLADLSGQIERITFTSEDTGYTVAKVKVYGRHDLVTCIGAMVNPTPGEIIKMKGEWTNNPKYGEQFKIVFCQTTTPATVYGIEKYLGSGLVKGIGPVMAIDFCVVFYVVIRMASQASFPLINARESGTVFDCHP